jgi:hypothetical protein
LLTIRGTKNWAVIGGKMSSPASIPPRFQASLMSAIQNQAISVDVSSTKGPIERVS